MFEIGGRDVPNLVRPKGVGAIAPEPDSGILPGHVL